ncbi:MAG: DUF1109 family protein [Beijerinckiaceae bacterium]|nr:MAG: DUF1109 family protein [Beijerinckiaceae bacterium]
MKTESLIEILAADRTVPTMPLSRALLLGLLPAVAVSLLLYAAVLGPRHHLLAQIAEPRLLFKIVFPFAVGVCAFPMVLRLVRPGANARRYRRLLLLLALVLIAAVASELMVVPPARWEASWIGHNARFCLVMIPGLSFAPLLATLIVLKRGAPTNPTLAGAGAGLLAAAIGATLYATHCPDDSPLFVASWYGLATLVVVIIGSIAGSKWLRW